MPGGRWPLTGVVMSGRDRGGPLFPPARAGQGRVLGRALAAVSVSSSWQRDLLWSSRPGGAGASCRGPPGSTSSRLSRMVGRRATDSRSRDLMAANGREEATCGRGALELVGLPEGKGRGRKPPEFGAAGAGPAVGAPVPGDRG